MGPFWNIALHVLLLGTGLTADPTNTSHPETSTQAFETMGYANGHGAGIHVTASSQNSKTIPQKKSVQNDSILSISISDNTAQSENSSSLVQLGGGNVTDQHVTSSPTPHTGDVTPSTVLMKKPKTPCQINSFVWRSILTGTVILCGIVVNTLSFLTFWATPKFNATTFILLCLAVIDNGVLVVYGVMMVLPNFCFYLDACLWYQRFVYLYTVAYVWPVASLFHMAATGVMVLVSFHRYIAVCWPHLVPRLGALKAAKLQVLVVVTCSILYNLPRFFDDYAFVVPNGSRTGLKYTVWASSPLYNTLYSVALYYLIIFLFPFTALIFMTYKLVRGLREAHAKRQQMTRSKIDELDMTSSLVAVVIVFIFCHSTNPIRRAMKAASTPEQMTCGTFYYTFVDISSFLVCVNSAVNFVLYCLFGKRFRRVLMARICNFRNKVYPVSSLGESTGDSNTRKQVALISRPESVVTNVVNNSN